MDWLFAGNLLMCSPSRAGSVDGEGVRTRDGVEYEGVVPQVSRRADD